LFLTNVPLNIRQVMVRLQKRGVAVQGVHFIKVFERATPHYE